MTETGDVIREGGCLCGAVRFRAAGNHKNVCYCHCEMCRRASGAPIMAFAAYHTAQVTWTGKEPRWRQSSDIARRAFCPECGSALTWQHLASPEWIDLAIGAFDDASTLVPTEHLWVERRIPWMDTQDSLPRYPRERKKA